MKKLIFSLPVLSLVMGMSTAYAFNPWASNKAEKPLEIKAAPAPDKKEGPVGVEEILNEVSIFAKVCTYSITSGKGHSVEAVFSCDGNDARIVQAFFLKQENSQQHYDIAAMLVTKFHSAMQFAFLEKGFQSKGCVASGSFDQGAVLSCVMTRNLSKMKVPVQEEETSSSWFYGQ